MVFAIRLTVVGPLLILIFWNSCSGSARAADDLKLYVAGLKAGETIPQRFRHQRQPCSGEDLSPEISWGNLPKQARSLAFVVWDEDAPKPGGFYHWALINIPRSVKALPEGAGNVVMGRTPHGAVQLINDWGEQGYGGPCPPGGRQHHYHFTLYALKADQLPIDQRTKAADAIGQIRNALLSSSELVLVAGS
ncbi:MAG TPA: YbhB/YbcL family Raf kinase inhibitor-like protein [Chthoniobacterales bacterium]